MLTQVCALGIKYQLFIQFIFIRDSTQPKVISILRLSYKQYGAKFRVADRQQLDFNNKLNFIILFNLKPQFYFNNTFDNQFKSQRKKAAEMKNQKFTPDDDSVEQLDTYSYTRGIGAYKPHFAGVPENYYPLNCKEITIAVFILIAVIGTTLGIMIGFIRWVEVGGLEGYIIAWVAVLIAFVVLMIICFYFGGKTRRRLEKQLIAENNRKQQEMVKNKKI